MTDIATRVYNHSWKIDPIVRSVLDTDFYKLLMAQTIFRRHRDVQVTFGIINRSASVPLARLIDLGELKEQLDHIRTLALSRGESTFLRGNMFYGKRQMFAPEFIAWLEGFRFPPYKLERNGDQYELIFEGPWIETTMWEIPALAVLMELHSRAVTKGMGKFELQVLYARAMTRLWEKIGRLKQLPGLSIADFGTRHGFPHLVCWLGHGVATKVDHMCCLPRIPYCLRILTYLPLAGESAPATLQVHGGIGANTTDSVGSLTRRKAGRIRPVGVGLHLFFLSPVRLLHAPSGAR